MISPNLIRKLNVDGPKEKYLLSTCSSSSKETKYGRRISGVLAKGLNERIVELPTMIECDHIPQDKSEIPTPDMTRPFPHLREISTGIPPRNPHRKRRPGGAQSKAIQEWTVWIALGTETHPWVDHLNCDVPRSCWRTSLYLNL